MSKQLTKLNLSESILKISKDGDCFFHCLKSTIQWGGLPTRGGFEVNAKTILELRNKIVDFIFENRTIYQEFETDKTDYNILRHTGSYENNEMVIAIRAACDCFKITIEIHQKLQEPVIYTSSWETAPHAEVLKLFRTNGHFDLIVTTSDYKKCHQCKSH